MNMISTGAFLNEMDASKEQPTVAEKFAAVWEKKNAKAARAGGVSLMALSLAACGSSSTTTTTTTDATTDTTPVTPAVDAAKTIALTTSTDAGASFTGGSGDDTFTATHLTLGTTDELYGGAGTDSLTLTNTGDAAYAMAVAKFDGIETLNITNQSGKAAVDAVTGTAETANVTFKDLAAGQTLQVGDIIYTAGSSGATAAQVAAAFANPLTAEDEDNPTIATADTLLVSGGKFTGFTQATGATGTLAAAAAKVDAGLSTAGWTVAAGGDVKSAVFTSDASSPSNVTDLNITGTGVTGKTSKTTFTVAEASTTSYDSDDDLTIVINGVTVTHPGVTATNNADNVILAEAFAAAINGHLGYTAATVATDSDTSVTTVTVETDTPVTIAGIASADAAETTIGAVTNAQAYMAAAAPTVVTTDGVATVSAVAAQTYETTVDASKIADATTMGSVNSTGAVTFSNMAATQNGLVSGNTVIANGNTTFGYKATVDTASVAIKDGMTAGDITLTGTALSSVAISSSGEKNTVGTIDVAGAKTVTVDAATDLKVTAISTSYASTAGTLTVTGAGKVTAGTLNAGLNTVDASGNSGGLVAAIGAETDTVLTGSAGNDKITASTSNTIASTAKLAVDAGSGTDTLVIAAADDVDSAAIGARYTGFEAMSVVASQDMSLVAGIESVAITADASTVDLSKMSAAQLANVTVSDDDGDNSVDFSLTLETATGTSDTASITAASATASQNVSITNLGVDDIETVNVAFTTGTAGTQSALDFKANAADEVTALNITGSADVKLTVDQHVFDVKAVTIDASALTGKFEIADGSSATLKSGSKVIGSAQDDTIAVDDNTGTTYEGGAGKDGFTAAAATLSATGSDDTSIDGGVGEDTLNISDANNLTMTDVNFTDVANFEKLVLAADGNVSLTVGTNFSTAFGSSSSITAADIGDNHSFTYAGGLYNGDTTIAVTTTTDGDATGDVEDYNITTGDGDDVVTLTASSFVSDGEGDGSINIVTDAGADTITLKIGTIADNATKQVVSIDAGAGADTISITKVNGAATGSEKANAIFTVEHGDSTTGAYDKITGFDEGDDTHQSDTIDFSGTAAVSDFAASTNSGTIKSHSITTGIATFDDVENFDTALIIDEDNLSDVLSYLAANTAANDTVGFAYDANKDGAITSADSTMIFHNGDTDSLVELIEVTGVTVLTTSLTVTDAAIQII